MNRPATSTPAAKDMTCLIMLETVITAPFLRIGWVDSDLAPRYACPPATRLRPLGTDRYDASLWICRAILLAQY
jgi:hypothetical protein